MTSLSLLKEEEFRDTGAFIVTILPTMNSYTKSSYVLTDTLSKIGGLLAVLKVSWFLIPINKILFEKRF